MGRQAQFILVKKIFPGYIISRLWQYGYGIAHGGSQPEPDQEVFPIHEQIEH